MVVNKEFKDLKFQAPKGGYVMLHRIEIYTMDDGSEDAIVSLKEFVDEMGVFCNLEGQRIKKPLHGIYIKDGKKYIFK